jgi:hypothetical protein
MYNDVIRFDYFPSSIFRVEKYEYLNNVKNVSYEYLKKSNQTTKFNEIYPVTMTENFNNDVRLLDFTGYISQLGWDILSSQGYSVEDKQTYITEMWLQDHQKYSSMDYHVHGGDTKLIGFYFLECYDNGSKLSFHDPRPSKIQSGIPENNIEELTYASNSAMFTPKPGTLIIANSWLPHSFTRNPLDKPIRLIHFCLSIGSFRNNNSAIIV